MDDVVGRRVGRRRDANRQRAIRGRDARGDAGAASMDTVKFVPCTERFTGVIGVRLNWRRALLGDRHADEAAAVPRHEIDRIGSDAIGGEHEVTLVLAILLVDEDDHSPGLDLRDDLDDGCDGHPRAPLQSCGTFYRSGASVLRNRQRLPARLIESALAACAVQQRQRFARQRTCGIHVVEHDAEMVPPGDGHRSSLLWPAMCRPRIPEQLRLPHEFGRFVGAYGDHQRHVHLWRVVDRRYGARAGFVEPEVGVVREQHERLEVVHARQRDAADERRRAKPSRANRWRYIIAARWPPAECPATTSGAGRAVTPAFAGNPGHRAAALVDDRRDRHVGTQVVVDDGDGEAGGDERGCDERVIGLVERAPVAAVNEQQRSARGSGGQEQIQRFLRPAAVAQVAQRRKRRDARRASAWRIGRASTDGRGPPRDCCSRARRLRASYAGRTRHVSRVAATISMASGVRPSMRPRDGRRQRRRPRPPACR